MISFILCVFLSQLILLPSSASLKQSVSVHGRLICNGTAYSKAKVILFNSLLMKLAETKPKNTGEFIVAWSGASLFPIVPVLNIYHRCQHQQQICSRMLSIKIPRDYVITDSSRVNATYDIGTTNLNLKYSFETIDCIFGV